MTASFISPNSQVPFEISYMDRRARSDATVNYLAVKLVSVSRDVTRRRPVLFMNLEIPGMS